MNPYRVDISEILDDLGASVEASDELPVDPIVVGDETFLPTEPPHFEVTLTNTGTAIVAMGSVTAAVTATCARCLCEFPTVIEGDVEGFYIHPGAESDVPEEQEIEYIASDGTVDIMPAIQAAIVLEAPFAPVHDEECAGLCPECGADLNEGPCGCESKPASDSPFAVLGGLELDEEDRAE